MPKNHVELLGWAISPRRGGSFGGCLVSGPFKSFGMSLLRSASVRSKRDHSVVSSLTTCSESIGPQEQHNLRCGLSSKFSDHLSDVAIIIFWYKIGY